MPFLKLWHQCQSLIVDWALCHLLYFPSYSTVSIVDWSQPSTRSCSVDFSGPYRELSSTPNCLRSSLFCQRRFVGLSLSCPRLCGLP